MSSRKRICYLRFSYFTREARLLRHLRFLGERYDFIGIGFGEDPSPALPGITLDWRPIPAPEGTSKLKKVLRTLARWPGRLIPALDWLPDKMNPAWHAAKKVIEGLEYDLFLGSDVTTLTMAVWQHRAKDRPFVMDYHEFAPLEAEEKRMHRWFHGPHSHRLLKRYGKLAAGTATVNQPFVERFKKDYGFSAVTVMNVPELRPLKERSPRTDDRIHLAFHGFNGPDRGVDTMVRAMGFLDDRFVLHLMLMSGAEPGSGLRLLADATAPNRVIFESPVPPRNTIDILAGWDIGLNLLHPVNYNNRHALPNKFFDYIHAGLAVISSEISTIQEIVVRNGIGWIVSEISPQALANLLRSLNPEEIRNRKAASLNLRERLHARNEEAQLGSLVDDVLSRKH